MPVSDCQKTSIVVKNGVWGVAPRQVAGTAVPVFSPFPGKGGRGIGIENLLCFIKMDFFYKLRQAQKCLPVNRFPHKKRKTASLQPLLRYAVSHDGKKSKNVR